MAKSLKKGLNKNKSKSGNHQKKNIIQMEKNTELKNTSVTKRKDNSSISNEPECNPLDVKFDGVNLMKAVIYSEILGKPRCKSRRKWR